MKHVLVIPSWLECKWGAGGSFFAEQAEIMRRVAGWKINMLMPCARHAVKVWRGKLSAASGVEIETRDGMEIWIGYYPYWLPRGRPRAWAHFGEKMFMQYADRHGMPDFLWAQSAIFAGFLAEHVRAKFGVPYFIHEHLTTFVAKKLPPLRRMRLRKVINGSVYCAAVGEELRRAVLRQTGAAAEKTCVIYNPVGFEFTDAAPRTKNRTEINFVSVCYLSKRKNTDAVVRAFAEIAEKFPAARLEIGGGGGEMQNLKSLAAELGVSEFVRFHGHLDRTQVRDLLLRSDAFVSASSIETFGVALAEALACGLPAIATKTGIAEKAINPENGVLLESAAPEEIAKAMRAVISGNYNSAQIRANALNAFSPQMFADRVQNALSEYGTFIEE